MVMREVVLNQAHSTLLDTARTVNAHVCATIL